MFPRYSLLIFRKIIKSIEDAIFYMMKSQAVSFQIANTVSMNDLKLSSTMISDSVTVSNRQFLRTKDLGSRDERTLLESLMIILQWFGIYINSLRHSIPCTTWIYVMCSRERDALLNIKQNLILYRPHLKRR